MNVSMERRALFARAKSSMPAAALACLALFGWLQCKAAPDGSKGAGDASPSASSQAATTLSATASPPAAVPPPQDLAAAPPGAEKTPSGLATLVLQKGSGDIHPSPPDAVTIHHTGWTKSGSMFDSSVLRQKPDTYKLEEVIAGWREGLGLMVAGEKRRFWVPAALAFGDAPRGPNEPYGDLVYDIELVSVQHVPPVPEDVAAPPKGAKRTGSNIPYRILRAGYGTLHPEPLSNVEVEFTAWTIDGKLYATSVTRDQPLRLSPFLWPSGLATAVMTLVEGDRARFWIPAKLATGGAGLPGSLPAGTSVPGGTVVYELELKSVAPPHWPQKR